jgi:hypothetical protein
LNVEEQYARALNADPENPYAHAHWGHWILWQHHSIDEAKPHFERALKSGRAKDYVRSLQLSALKNRNDFEATIELVRVWNDMRVNNEPLSPQMRESSCSWAYSYFRREMLENFTTILPASEHLATFLWLTEGLDKSLVGTFWQARLTEATGDRQKALQLYQGIEAEQSVFEDEIQEGIKRCTGATASSSL